MKLYITDECNQSWDDKVGFFMYGGIVVDEKDIISLSNSLDEIKSSYGLSKDRVIKWTNNKQAGTTLDTNVHREIKNEILNKFSESSSKIIICFSPHNFYHTNSAGKMTIDPVKHIRTLKYGVNDRLEMFNKYLVENNELGMMLADEFTSGIKKEMLEHCMSLHNTWRSTNVVLPIKGYDNAENNLHQINDVILGSIFYSLREVGVNLIPQIKGNFLGYPNINDIFSKGFIVLPKVPRYNYYLALKDEMKNKFIRRMSGNTE
jgi:hypothetical protein